MEQIAVAAHVSKVTIYNQFGDKRGLFAAAVERECARMGEHFSIAPMPGLALRDRLEAIGKAMMDFMSRPEMVQFDRRIAAETELNPAIGAAFLEAGPRQMLRAFTALLCALRDAGEITVEDPEMAAEQFVAMCKGLGDLERHFGCENDTVRNQSRIAAAVDTFCRAYGTARGG
ncbi:TetR/AcrR family transcriptional regulator [Sphingomonas sp. R647]|uniref:TetR/AcrR family transcriptional regulator n=1 Tax=Sphingomonas sp. R647 TaxID=2875233 RepID=UPI001CD3D92F|nr:TetR/AcrR family transcriptional regulator [Sphingomonas sp. R647]MCA1196543.1 TetR/AcrR family transcriptional regulator [Sphingomonas sp. R647]